MQDVIKMDTIADYGNLYGLEMIHPQVAVIDLTHATCFPTHFTMNYGVYALYLKQTRCGDLRYGKQPYDYQEGTITSFAPGQVVEVHMEEGSRPMARGLLFHPDFIRGTELGRDIRHYSFFSYASNEALHLSDEERNLFEHCLEQLDTELRRPADRHSRLICRNIELLLDYCLRFYDRQFTTRTPVNKGILMKFEEMLNDYFQSDKPQEMGLPTVKYFAAAVNLSPNYFGDLVKKETGRTAQEYIQNKLVNVAKQEMLASDKSISEIAYCLGFQYPQHFARIFKKAVGTTPTAYRCRQV